jgi:hypothetical protein
MRTRVLVHVLMSALAASAALTMGVAVAEETAAAAAKQYPPEEVDRDGKHIVGYSLMTESERAGYKSTLHFMKALADRDDFRKTHRASMAKRAKEKGVPLEE